METATETHRHEIRFGRDYAFLIGGPVIGFVSADIDFPLDEGRITRKRLVELHDMMSRSQDKTVKRDFSSIWHTTGAEFESVLSWLKTAITQLDGDEFRYVKTPLDLA